MSWRSQLPARVAPGVCNPTEGCKHERGAHFGYNSSRWCGLAFVNRARHDISTLTEVPPARRAAVGSLKTTAFATNIDRRQCKRVVPMKDLALALPRTGTSSVRQALLDLGYDDVYHYASVLDEDPRDAEMWFWPWKWRGGG